MGDVEANLQIDDKEKIVTVSVNPKIYPVDVIMSASYLFTDRYFVYIDGDIEEEILVEIRPKNDSESLRRIGREFNNELINFANYAIQAIKNQGIRDAVMNRVLQTNTNQFNQGFEQGHHEEHSEPCDCYEGNPTQFDGEEGSWEFDDPEGIAVPWEEKYQGETPAAPMAASVEEPCENCDEPIDDSDDFEDPEGIAIPWEEKYGKDAVN